MRVINGEAVGCDLSSSTTTTAITIVSLSSRLGPVRVSNAALGFRAASELPVRLQGPLHHLLKLVKMDKC